MDNRYFLVKKLHSPLNFAEFWILPSDFKMENS